MNRNIILGIIIGVVLLAFASIGYMYGHYANIIEQKDIMINKIVKEKSRYFHKIGYNNEADRLKHRRDRMKTRTEKEKLSRWVYRNSNVPHSVAEKIVRYSLETDHPFLLLSLFKTESHFNPMAVSDRDAYGLGQITETFEGMLKDLGTINEMRDLLVIETAVIATEVVWEYFLEKTNGKVRDTLSCYLGATNGTYINTILEDYYYLNYLCNDYELAKPKVKEKEKEITNKDEVVVEVGDTLYKLCYEVYGEANSNIVNIVAKANGLDNPNIIDEGMVLVFPNL